MINPEVKELPTHAQVLARIDLNGSEMRSALMWLKDFRLLPLFEQITQATQLAQRDYAGLFGLDEFSAKRHQSARQKLDDAVKLLRNAFEDYQRSRQPHQPDLEIQQFVARLPPEKLQLLNNHLHSFLSHESHALAGYFSEYEEHRPIYSKWLMMHSGALTKLPRGLLNPVYEEDRLPEDCPDYKTLGMIVHMTRLYGQFRSTYCSLPFDKLVSYCAQLHYLVNQLDFQTIDQLHEKLLACDYPSKDYAEAFHSSHAIKRFGNEAFALKAVYCKRPDEAPSPIVGEPTQVDYERLGIAASRVRTQMNHLQNLIQRAFRTYIQAHQYLETA